jgi:small multidrug resistance pump
VLAYALSFWLLALVLRVIPVGVAYAIWSGLGVCLIAGIGWVVFGQRLDAPAMLGLGLIIAGILVINIFSTSVGH